MERSMKDLQVMKDQLRAMNVGIGQLLYML